MSLKVTDNNGCESTSGIININVYPKPIADFNYAPYKPIVNDAEVTITDASFNANIVKWDWYFKNQANPHSNIQNPVYTYEDEGNYSIALVVMSDYGCSDTIIKTIVVGPDFGIYVPNAFTPNGDGINDTFQPKGFGIVKYELAIFDRWGEKLFETNVFEQGWERNYLGRSDEFVKDGVYVWKINLTSVFGKSHELTGHVTMYK